MVIVIVSPPVSWAYHQRLPAHYFISGCPLSVSNTISGFPLVSHASTPHADVLPQSEPSSSAAGGGLGALMCISMKYRIGSRFFNLRLSNEACVGRGNVGTPETRIGFMVFFLIYHGSFCFAMLQTRRIQGTLFELRGHSTTGVIVFNAISIF